jgi:FkbM family methyltransferase
MITVIAEHSFDIGRINPGAPILDVGCRSFSPAKELASLGFDVIAMDPDPEIIDPGITGIRFVKEALVAPNEVGMKPYASFGNGTGNFIVGDFSDVPTLGIIETVNCVDISELSQRFGVDDWGAIKLDCEGSEFEILQQWPGPIADQISVEFHEHTRSNPGAGYYEDLFKILGRWYRVAQHEKTARHGLVPNYWDSLFIRR